MIRIWRAPQNGEKSSRACRIRCRSQSIRRRIWSRSPRCSARRPPQRIEGFDISNISGTFKVASLVSFKMGGLTAPTIGGSKSNPLQVRTTSPAWRRSSGGTTPGAE